MLSNLTGRFTLASTLLSVAFIAATVALVDARIRLAKSEAKLAEIRGNYAILEADDKSNLYALEIPSYALLEWRWAFQRPLGNGYTLKYAFGSGEQPGVPLQHFDSYPPPAGSLVIRGGYV
ncbi:MAG: hypothetical protein Aurels2KO_52090 [Aureliella sp.]